MKNFLTNLCECIVLIVKIIIAYGKNICNYVIDHFVKYIQWLIVALYFSACAGVCVSVFEIVRDWLCG